MAGRLDRMGSVHVSAHSLYYVSVADVAAYDLHMTHQRISLRCVNTWVAKVGYTGCRHVWQSSAPAAGLGGEADAAVEDSEDGEGGDLAGGSSSKLIRSGAPRSGAPSVTAAARGSDAVMCAMSSISSTAAAPITDLSDARPPCTTTLPVYGAMHVRAMSG